MRVLFQSPIDDTGSTSSSSLTVQNNTPTTPSNIKVNSIEFQTPSAPEAPLHKSNSRLCISTVRFEHDKCVGANEDHDIDTAMTNVEQTKPSNYNETTTLKKTVLFKIHDHQNDDVDDIDDIDDEDFSHDDNLDDDDYYNNSPMLDRTKCRYKSEPNLSKLNDCTSATYDHHIFDEYRSTKSPSKQQQRSHFANRLIKGISLGSLILPSVKKSMEFFCRSPSPPAVAPDRRLGSSNSTNETITSGAFKSWNDDINWNAIGEQSAVTGTHYMIERNSMSPITKSTQRMPKSMQVGGQNYHFYLIRLPFVNTL